MWALGLGFRVTGLGCRLIRAWGLRMMENRMASNITWDINWKLELELVLSYVISTRNPDSVPWQVFSSHTRSPKA